MNRREISTCLGEDYIHGVLLHTFSNETRVSAQSLQRGDIHARLAGVAVGGLLLTAVAEGFEKLLDKTKTPTNTGQRKVGDHCRRVHNLVFVSQKECNQYTKDECILTTQGTEYSGEESAGGGQSQVGTIQVDSPHCRNWYSGDVNTWD